MGELTPLVNTNDDYIVTTATHLYGHDACTSSERIGDMDYSGYLKMTVQTDQALTVQVNGGLTQTYALALSMWQAMVLFLFAVLVIAVTSSWCKCGPRSVKDDISSTYGSTDEFTLF